MVRTLTIKHEITGAQNTRDLRHVIESDVMSQCIDVCTVSLLCCSCAEYSIAFFSDSTWKEVGLYVESKLFESVLMSISK